MKPAHPIRYVPALLLAGTAAAFAVSGLPAMFPGSPYGAVALGIAVEVGTLFAFHELPRLRGILKACVLAVALIAAGLNALGVYGFLAKAHIKHAAEMSVSVDIKHEESLLADIDRRLMPPTASTTEVVKHGKRTVVTTPGKVDPKLVDKLEAERADHLGTLTALQRRQQMTEAELGPAKYLADLLGATADRTMELVIAAFVLTLQPFAIVLLWAANHGHKEHVPVLMAKPKAVRRKTVRKAKRKKAPAVPRVANDNVLLFPAA